MLSCDGPQNRSDVTLETAEQFGDVGFVFDVRLKEHGKSLQFGLRDAAIDTSDAAISTHLDQTGRWNRFEGTLQGSRLSLTVNGREAFQNRAVEKLAERGAISISPSGPIELANIYVRELSATIK